MSDYEPGALVHWKLQSRHSLRRGRILAIVLAHESLCRAVVKVRGELGPGALGLSKEEAALDRYLVEDEAGRLHTPRVSVVDRSMRQWPTEETP